MKHKAKDARKRDNEPSKASREKARRQERRQVQRFKHGEG